ncbi:Htaa protein [Microcella putealis]|uniref:Htaa protein n=2 Tax=Microcella putealis TaxID=337005 RepID=A0A4Q7LHD0_9MICO|nr:Htaa protein [Microcella putealis]TQM26915.1 Htaa protein [Microcella putealis]
MRMRGRAPAAVVAAALVAGGAMGSAPVGLAALAAAAVAPGDAPGACAITDAELVWGFKESFRAYISGSIANGEWEALDGARYETPVFTFAGGAGTAEEASGEAEIAFAGAMRFTGHDGVLDTLIANPRIVVTGPGNASLVADVTGTRQDFEEVEAFDVRFVELDLAAAEAALRQAGQVTLTGIPAQLTEEGADAFGTYPAGEPFDAVDVSYALADDCAVAPGVDRAALDPAVIIALAGTGLLAVVGVIAAVATRPRRGVDSTPAQSAP